MEAGDDAGRLGAGEGTGSAVCGAAWKGWAVSVGPRPVYPEWNEHSVVRLRMLWDAGHSAAQIGRMIGRSKNSVVGKAHRLDLSARPDPIARDGIAKPRTPRPSRAKGVTLAPLFALLDDPIVLAAPPRERPAPKPAVGECCYPIGDPGTKAFRFCCDPTEPGRSYCLDHCKLAYVNYQPRRAADVEIAA